MPPYKLDAGNKARGQAPAGHAPPGRRGEQITAQRLAEGLDENDKACEASEVSMREYDEHELTKPVRDHNIANHRALYGLPQVARTASGALRGMVRG